MEQAYNHFNSGKYKQAYKQLCVQYSLLSSSSINIDSYEPNLAICEYLSNRCVQTSVNCHRKLIEWLNKKFKRENYKLDSQTESIVKFNIAILFILLGKRDNALLVMTDIFKNKTCFIEYMQSRIMLLLMELNVTLRNPTSALNLFRKYILKPQGRNPSSHWVSLILHEHNKSWMVCKEEFYFFSRILLNQALMQLSFSQNTLTTKQSDDQLRQHLIERIKRRKNNISKYYEINVLMISRFHQAQKLLHSGNRVKCLELMNFANIQNDVEQMPSTKIITNILNALTTSNVGIVHFWQLKYHIALQYFFKAKSLLSKGITGVEDKDLQLFWINYSSHNESITYNMALCLLATQSKEAYQLFESIKKCSPNNQNFKWWYRVGQALLQNYHEVDKKNIDPLKLTEMLEEVEECFYCALSLLEKNKFPQQNLLKTIVPQVSEQQIELAHMKFKAQKRQFKRSITIILCYVYNNLGKFSQTLKLGKQILREDLPKPDRTNILHYMMEAYIITSREQETRVAFAELRKQTQTIKGIKTEGVYSKEPQNRMTLTYEELFLYQTSIWYIKNGQVLEACSLVQSLRAKAGLNPNPVIKLLMRYLHIELGLDKKFVGPYLK